MESVAEIRAEARRLQEAVKNTSDVELQKELAERAFGLAERAEALERSIESPQIIRMNIARYKSLLAAGITDAPQKEIVEAMLADLEALLG